jgi:beta-N-acetylhexosaminidase
MPVPRPLGPVMLGIEGTALTAADRERLVHPHVGGVILFARNYGAPEPLRALTADIRQLREPALLIAVDHEGGRVQRFREGFTAIPPMRTLGERFDQDRDGALAEAQRWGRMIADELGGCGIDFSFTPVLDLDAGVSEVIGRRAFHATPRIVGDLAAALCRGLHAGGMASVGKHFPGHGNVAEDSHAALPVDPRPYGDIAARDLLPFAQLADAHLLDAVMPAHVLYPAVDAAPAGFSAKWLREILRGEIGFDGLIFSDDLEMAGAHVVGDIVARADAARSAGCDMVLACNDFTAMEELLERWRPSSDGDLAWRAAAMRRRT